MYMKETTKEMSLLYIHVIEGPVLISIGCPEGTMLYWMHAAWTET